MQQEGLGTLHRQHCDNIATSGSYLSPFDCPAQLAGGRCAHERLFNANFKGQLIWISLQHRVDFTVGLSQARLQSDKSVNDCVVVQQDRV